MSNIVATRQAFGEELLNLMQTNENVITLTADLGESLRLLDIRTNFPERFFDIGVAEANMAGIAAGMAIAGFTPVAGTFAVFMTRAFDHIRMQICQNNLHVIMVGSHGGVSNALDGGSAHALEDIAYMRALPNMTVLFPIDAHQTKQALQAAVVAKGPVYLRLYREPTPIVTEANKLFTIGQAQIIKSGKDVSVIASGPQVAFALEAARQLESQNISVEVVAVPTIQPLDNATIVDSARRTGKVITVEDHNVNGGLGSAVAEVLSEQQPTRLRRLGVRQFGESGKYSELIAKLGIDTASIIKAVQDFV
jgi:transketolase